MEYYQLSRLYYCFSSTKIYSNKGYPNWLFTIMFTGMAIIFFCLVISPWFGYNISRVCGINKKYQYYTEDYTYLNNYLNRYLIYSLEYIQYGILLLYYCM